MFLLSSKRNVNLLKKIRLHWVIQRLNYSPCTGRPRALWLVCNYFWIFLFFPDRYVLLLHCETYKFIIFRFDSAIVSASSWKIRNKNLKIVFFERIPNMKLLGNDEVA